jgi:4-amino-4-deoxy-L-arabinose transferase-like glycosyltransferase
MTQSSVAPTERYKFPHRHWVRWFVVATILLVALVRLRLLNLPLERDEGEYAYAGQLMLRGVPPYQLAGNMKFPGTYAAYAIIMAGFGQTPAGIHLGVLCATVLTAGMLFRLGQRMLDETAGLVAAGAYTVLAASPAILGLEGHAAHFVALFATAGLCLLLPVRESIRWGHALAGGFMLGMAMLMIQHGIFFCLWGLMFLAVAGPRPPGMVWTKRLPLLAAGSLGMALPLGLTCLVLWHAGVLDRFWFWTISYARQYVSLVPPADVPMNFFTGFSKAVGGNALFWIAALVGLRLLWLDLRLREYRFALIGFALASLLATCPGFYFRPHYFLLTLPAVALLAGCGVSGVESIFRDANGSTAWRKAWPGVAFGLMVAVGVFLNRQVWFELKPARASREIYGFDLFSQAGAAAAFIQANTPPNARVAVLGSEPEIYFLSHRRSATSYLYTYALMEPQPFAHRMQQEMIGEIESARPECITVVTFNDSWISRPESDHEIFDWWDSYRTNYHLLRSFPITPAPEGSALLIYQRTPAMPPAKPPTPNDPKNP